MTHNYIYELNLLKELLPLVLPYIGILGPKKKLERMLAELEDTGTKITPEQLDKIYGPVGLGYRVGRVGRNCLVGSGRDQGSAVCKERFITSQ
jgi:xanthine/CO dehydrogenase XdhC/CoxF family maturation factor